MSKKSVGEWLVDVIVTVAKCLGVAAAAAIVYKIFGFGTFALEHFLTYLGTGLGLSAIAQGIKAIIAGKELSDRGKKAVEAKDKDIEALRDNNKELDDKNKEQQIQITQLTGERDVAVAEASSHKKKLESVNAVLGDMETAASLAETYHELAVKASDATTRSIYEGKELVELQKLSAYIDALKK